jgi:uncharacterized protein (TIGR00297 family)
VQGLPVSLLLAAFLAAAVVLSALRLRWLSPSGALAAFLVGWVTFASGSWQAAAVLLTFFVTSSALGRWRVGRKRRMELLTARGSRRQAAQVLANGGVATACIAVYALTGDVHWWLAFVGAYAAANADTWSSEIGALSPVPPRHVLTLRPLQPGDSGGVTVLGLLAGGAGSVVVGSCGVGGAPARIRAGGHGHAGRTAGQPAGQRAGRHDSGSVPVRRVRREGGAPRALRSACRTCWRLAMDR